MARKHVIKQGESVIGLAEDHGLFPNTIWNDPANAALRKKRADMSILMPDDVVVIPRVRPKEVRIKTGARSTFRRKGIPGKLRLQLLENGLPRKEQDYRLTVDGQLAGTGKTDADGFFEAFVSGNAQTGLVVVGPDAFELELSFGHLDPHDEISGLQQRLNNLNFPCGAPDGELGERTRAALRRFQASHPDLKVTGDLDSDTLDALTALHDKLADAPQPQNENPQR